MLSPPYLQPVVWALPMRVTFLKQCCKGWELPGRLPSYLEEHASMDTVIPELMVVVQLTSTLE